MFRFESPFHRLGSTELDHESLKIFFFRGHRLRSADFLIRSFPVKTVKCYPCYGRRAARTIADCSAHRQMPVALKKPRTGRPRVPAEVSSLRRRVNRPTTTPSDTAPFRLLYAARLRPGTPQPI